MQRHSFVLGGLVLVSLIALSPKSYSCSRVLWNDNGFAVLVGRNMDWFEDMHSNIWLLPRGMKRNGLAEENPLTWTSQYGSVVVTGYEAGSLDGVNEKGLAVHALYLPETETGTRDPSLPGLCMSMWVQYYLDQFATVAEAVEAEPYQLVMAVEPTSQKPLTLHLAMNDKSGDSAILECINGELKVYHSRDYTVMTNQPTFDQQLERIKQYRGFGGDKQLPGSTEPSDRFVRGAYYLKNLPKPDTEREAVASLMSVMRNVSAPFGIPDPNRPHISTTIWRTVIDLSNGVMFYDSVMSPQVFWIDINKLDFAAGQPVRKITVVDNYDLMGEVSGEFQEAEMFEFLRPE